MVCLVHDEQTEGLEELFRVPAGHHRLGHEDDEIVICIYFVSSDSAHGSSLGKRLQTLDPLLLEIRLVHYNGSASCMTAGRRDGHRSLSSAAVGLENGSRAGIRAQRKYSGVNQGLLSDSL